MKSGIAMVRYALTRARTEGLTPAEDIVLALVCDDESGGDNGARFLVEEHSEPFEGVRYAIGEFGGFSFKLGRRRFYPIMVAEKQVCHLKVTFRGANGHASLNHQDNPMANLARFLKKGPRPATTGPCDGSSPVDVSGHRQASVPTLPVRNLSLAESTPHRSHA